MNDENRPPNLPLPSSSSYRPNQVFESSFENSPKPQATSTVTRSSKQVLYKSKVLGNNTSSNTKPLFNKENNVNYLQEKVNEINIGNKQLKESTPNNEQPPSKDILEQIEEIQSNLDDKFRRLSNKLDQKKKRKSIQGNSKSTKVQNNNTTDSRRDVSTVSRDGTSKGIINNNLLVPGILGYNSNSGQSSNTRSSSISSLGIIDESNSDFNQVFNDIDPNDDFDSLLNFDLQKFKRNLSEKIFNDGNNQQQNKLYQTKSFENTHSKPKLPSTRSFDHFNSNDNNGMNQYVKLNTNDNENSNILNKTPTNVPQLRSNEVLNVARSNAGNSESNRIQLQSNNKFKESALNNQFKNDLVQSNSDFIPSARQSLAQDFIPARQSLAQSRLSLQKELALKCLEDDDDDDLIGQNGSSNETCSTVKKNEHNFNESNDNTLTRNDYIHESDENTPTRSTFTVSRNGRNTFDVNDFSLNKLSSNPFDLQNKISLSFGQQNFSNTSNLSNEFVTSLNAIEEQLNEGQKDWVRSHAPIPISQDEHCEISMDSKNSFGSFAPSDYFGGKSDDIQDISLCLKDQVKRVRPKPTQMNTTITFNSTFDDVMKSNVNEFSADPINNHGSTTMDAINRFGSDDRDSMYSGVSSVVSTSQLARILEGHGDIGAHSTIFQNFLEEASSKNPSKKSSKQGSERSVSKLNSTRNMSALDEFDLSCPQSASSRIGSPRRNISVNVCDSTLYLDEQKGEVIDSKYVFYLTPCSSNLIPFQRTNQNESINRTTTNNRNSSTSTRYSSSVDSVLSGGNISRLSGIVSHDSLGNKSHVLGTNSSVLNETYNEQDITISSTLETMTQCNKPGRKEIDAGYICIGTSLAITKKIVNPSSYTLVCQMNIKSIVDLIDGTENASAAIVLFDMDQIEIQGSSYGIVKVYITPLKCGTLSVGYTLKMLHETIEFSECTEYINLQSEVPQIEMVSPNMGVVNFGSLPTTYHTNEKVTLLNRSKSKIPLKLVVSSDEMNQFKARTYVEPNLEWSCFLNIQTPEINSKFELLNGRFQILLDISQSILNQINEETSLLLHHIHVTSRILATPILISSYNIVLTQNTQKQITIKNICNINLNITAHFKNDNFNEFMMTPNFKNQEIHTNKVYNVNLKFEPKIGSDHTRNVELIITYNEINKISINITGILNTTNATINEITPSISSTASQMLPPNSTLTNQLFPSTSNIISATSTSNKTPIVTSNKTLSLNGLSILCETPNQFSPKRILSSAPSPTLSMASADGSPLELECTHTSISWSAKNQLENSSITFKLRNRNSHREKLCLAIQNRNNNDCFKLLKEKEELVPELRISMSPRECRDVTVMFVPPTNKGQMNNSIVITRVNTNDTVNGEVPKRVISLYGYSGRSIIRIGGVQKDINNRMLLSLTSSSTQAYFTMMNMGAAPAFVMIRNSNSELLKIDKSQFLLNPQSDQMIVEISLAISKCGSEINELLNKSTSDVIEIAKVHLTYGEESTRSRLKRILRTLPESSSVLQDYPNLDTALNLFNGETYTNTKKLHDNKNVLGSLYASGITNVSIGILMERSDIEMLLLDTTVVFQELDSTLYKTHFNSTQNF